MDGNAHKVIVQPPQGRYAGHARNRQPDPRPEPMPGGSSTVGAPP